MRSARNRALENMLKRSIMTLSGEGRPVHRRQVCFAVSLTLHTTASYRGCVLVLLRDEVAGSLMLRCEHDGI